MKMIPAEEPSPLRPKVLWYDGIALIAPIRDESKPFRVDTRYPTPMMPYSFSMLFDQILGFCASRAAAKNCQYDMLQ